jgi:hypothetical protein
LREMKLMRRNGLRIQERITANEAEDKLERVR